MQEVQAHPGLGTRTDAGVDDCRSTGLGIGLSVEAEVGTEELDALVVSFLDHPLLVGRVGLVVVGAVASFQGYGSSVARVGHLIKAKGLWKQRGEGWPDNLHSNTVHPGRAAVRMRRRTTEPRRRGPREG